MRRWAWLVACGLVAGCFTRPATQILVVIGAEPAIDPQASPTAPAGSTVSSVEVTVTREGDSHVLFNQTFQTRVGVAGSFQFPGTLTLVPATENDSSRYSVQVEGVLGDLTRVVFQQWNVSFVPETTETLEFTLTRDCINVLCPPDPTTGAAETCSLGMCAAQTLPSLPTTATPLPWAPNAMDAGWSAEAAVDVPPPLDLGADRGVSDVVVVDTGVDAGMDAGVDAAVDAGPSCGAGQIVCGGACVTTGTDPANCGSCGHACAAGQTCSGGTCSTGACPSGMAVIPAGTFMMGAADLSGYGATPVHTVTLTSYCMDVTEVTVAAYATCPSGTCTAPATSTNCNWMVAGRDSHPINCVTWDQSRAYCQWVHGGGGDLPTEAQWEYAAAGGAMDWEYPWGNDAPANQLCWSGGSAGRRSSTCPVMSFPTPADAFGLFDMAGNVWEWTGDCYGAYSAMAAVNPTGPTGSCRNRVFRGGGWGDSVPSNVRVAERNYSYPSNSGYNVGFRCARSTP